MIAVPCALHARKYGEQALDFAGFERGRWLVEDQEPAASPQRLGDGDELTLGEAQPVNAQIGIGSEIELPQLCARLFAHARARSTTDTPSTRRTGGSPSVKFSATESAGTSRSSCGMVAMPAAIASCGPLKWRAMPSTSTLALIGPVHAAEDADQCRFAGAVLAHQRVDFARQHVEIDVIERARGAELL